MNRSISSSDLKASLGDILASLPTRGAVDVTRNGRQVAVLSPSSTEKRAPRAHLATLAPLYAAGTLTWREVEEQAEVSFGELLVELSHQGLTLPTVEMPSRGKGRAELDALLGLRSLA